MHVNLVAQDTHADHIVEPKLLLTPAGWDFLKTRFEQRAFVATGRDRGHKQEEGSIPRAAMVLEKASRTVVRETISESSKDPGAETPRTGSGRCRALEVSSS